MCGARRGQTKEHWKQCICNYCRVAVFQTQTQENDFRLLSPAQRCCETTAGCGLAAALQAQRLRASCIRYFLWLSLVSSCFGTNGFKQFPSVSWPDECSRIVLTVSSEVKNFNLLRYRLPMHSFSSPPNHPRVIRFLLDSSCWLKSPSRSHRNYHCASHALLLLTEAKYYRKFLSFLRNVQIGSRLPDTRTVRFLGNDFPTYPLLPWRTCFARVHSCMKRRADLDSSSCDFLCAFCRSSGCQGNVPLLIADRNTFSKHNAVATSTGKFPQPLHTHLISAT